MAKKIKRTPLTEEQKKLAEKHINLVRHIVKRVMGSMLKGGNWVDRDDLVSAGFLKLVDCARTYKPDRGVAFTTYSYPYIYKFINQEVRNNRIIKVTDSMQLRVIQRRTDPTFKDKNTVFESTINKAEQFMSTCGKDYNFLFDHNLEPSNHSFRVANYNFVEKIAKFDNDLLLDLPAVMNQLNKLTQREQDIIKERLYFYGNKRKTFEELSKLYKISRERVRQIQEEGIEKIRRGLGII